MGIFVIQSKKSFNLKAIKVPGKGRCVRKGYVLPIILGSLREKTGFPDRQIVYFRKIGNGFPFCSKGKVPDGKTAKDHGKKQKSQAKTPLLLSYGGV